MKASGPPRRRRPPLQWPDRPLPREMRLAVVQPDRSQPLEAVISGRCWVIDGDTIVIDKMHIRLAGIDAPELDHPWGQQAKWAMVKLCKGQTVTARLKPEMSYDRLVAECFLPDGRDLAAELVRVGLALDWPKFSGGKYRHLEPADARKKLWRANLRQSGVIWPADDIVPVAPRPFAPRPQTATPVRVGLKARPPRKDYWIGWLVASFTFAFLVGCQLIGGDTERNAPAAVRQPAAALASFTVTASVLNVRERPAAGSRVLGQIGIGTTVTPNRVSGAWYGIDLPDGSAGWVHSDFLGPTAD